MLVSSNHGIWVKGDYGHDLSRDGNDGVIFQEHPGTRRKL